MYVATLMVILVLVFPFLVPSTEVGNCSTGSIRLNGSSPLEGRVEICINNAWGTICNNRFSSSDPIVICRHLGYDSIAAYSIPLLETLSSGPIFLDELECDGNEENVLDCHYSIGVHSCSHDQDIAIKCVGKYFTAQKIMIITIKLREQWSQIQCTLHLSTQTPHFT